MSRRQTDSAGFTIIELLVATLIFSVIILTVTAAVIRFSKQYYHGVIVNATQDTARSVMDDLVRSIQFNGGDVLAVDNGYCLGSTKRYSFKLNQQITDSGIADHQGRHALVADTQSDCATGSGLAITPNTTLPAANNARELLGHNMRLVRFAITEKPVGSKTYVANLKIAYGDDDLLTCAPYSLDDVATSADCQKQLKCKPEAGAEYCAIAQLTTVIKKRIN